MSHKKMLKALEIAVTDAAEKVRQSKEPSADLLSALAKLTSAVRDLYGIEEPKRRQGWYVEQMMSELEAEQKAQKKKLKGKY